MKINFRDDKYFEYLEEVLNSYNPSEELLNELIKCGLELNKNEENTPWVIETEEELEKYDVKNKVKKFYKEDDK